jgi:hypothetical protein
MNKITIINQLTGKSFYLLGDLETVYKAFLCEFMGKGSPDDVVSVIRDSEANEIVYIGRIAA